MSDEIFLLSKEEYEKHKKNIPVVNNWWWLRSPGYSSRSTAYVDLDGSVDFFGYYVGNDSDSVRPALQILNHNFKVGDRFIEADFPWIVISENIAIAEVPIAFRRFDPSSNDYQNSEIRKFLLDWYKERKRK